MRVFPFNVYVTTIMIEELFGHENPDNEEPLAAWMVLKRRQQWRAPSAPIRKIAIGTNVPGIVALRVSGNPRR